MFGNYCMSNINNTLYIEDFKNSTLKLARCTKKRDTTAKDRQEEIIRNYPKGKMNHRNMNETEKEYQK